MNLVEDNIKLVHYIAQKFKKRAKSKGIDYEDLVQVGCEGLIKSATRYDAARGVEFSAFAIPTVTGEMQRHLRDWSVGAKVSRPYYETLVKLSKIAEWEKKKDQELAELVGVNIEFLKKVRKWFHDRNPESLDKEVLEEGNQITIGDLIGVDQDNSEIYVKEFMERLGERDQAIVQMLLEGENQADIGKVIGVRQASVSRIIRGQLKTELTRYMNGDPMSKNRKHNTREQTQRKGVS